MNRDIFLSTFSHNAAKEIAFYGIGIEFNQFCISRWLDEETIDDTLTRMRRQAERCGICLPAKAIVHGPFTDLAPAAFDHRFRDLTRTRFDQAAAGTLALGLTCMVVHTGYIPLIFDPRWQVKESIGFWQEFLQDKPEDFLLLLENVMDEKPALLLDIVDGVDDPRMKICLDVGHVNAISEISVPEWIETLGSRIRHLHLHNNDGIHDLHQPLTEGTLDMEEVLRAVDACCPPDTTLTIESRDCHDSIRWLLDR